MVVAQSLESNETTLDKLGLVMFIFGAAGVIAAALAGWGVARNGLRPVRRLTDAAEDIARTEKLDPIDVEGNDEIARLARAFNAMLAALSASRDRQRQLVADAGHELRTPLTSLRTNLDLLTQADRQGGLSDGVAGRAARRRAVPDRGAHHADRRPHRAGPRASRPRCCSRRSTWRRSPSGPCSGSAGGPAACSSTWTPEPWWVTGEAAALERAVTNLLDNAAKWSPPLGVVTIRLADGDADRHRPGPRHPRGGPAARVRPVLPVAGVAHACPGSGLGLAIVRQVAERHGGVRSGPAGPTRSGRGSRCGCRGTRPRGRTRHSAVTGGSQRTLSGG